MIPPPARLARLFPAFLLLAASGVPARAQEGMMDNSGPPPPPPPLILFFPPPPTVYGAPVPDAPASAQGFLRMNGKAMVTPEELADFVDEVFYPMLGARLRDHTLSKKLRARLDAYRAARAVLRNELEDRLAALENAESAVRLAELQVLAKKQAPGIAALEEEADQLRHDLIPGGFLAGMSVNWRSTNTWRLGTSAVASDPWKTAAEFEVARATAYFQDNLGIEQRGLLRELAAELAARSRSLVTRGRAAEESGELYFSPATAQLRWPDGLGAALTAKIGHFNSDRAALKEELMDALNALDQASDSKRAHEFDALTQRQRPRIDALEQLAEEIRTGVAALAVRSVELPPIPPELRDEIDRYTEDRRALLTALNAALAPVRRPPVSMDELSRKSSDDRMAWMRERDRQWADARREVTQAFSRDNADRLTDLHERYLKIIDGVTAVASGLKDPKSGRAMTVPDLLTAYRLTLLRFDEIGREEAIYALYRTAMLQPGLSPAQRRLLFGAAHASLAQALPVAEVTMPNSPRPRLLHP